MSQLPALTANGSTTPIAANGAYTLSAAGTFDSATVTMQASWDGGTTYHDLTDSSGTAFAATANQAENIDVAKCLFRATMSSAGGSSSVIVSIVTFRDLR